MTERVVEIAAILAINDLLVNPNIIARSYQLKKYLELAERLLYDGKHPDRIERMEALIQGYVDKNT